MARSILPLLLLLTLASCASDRARRSEYAPSVVKGDAARVPNLVLGPAAEDAWIAEAFAGRSRWPSVDRGYLLDSTTYITQFRYDDQSFFDRLGGGFIDSTETIRDEVWVR